MPPPGFLKSSNNTEEWASWWTGRGEEGGREGALIGSSE